MSGHIDPTRAQFDAFKGLDRDTPIDMLNLVKVHSKAAYPDEHAFGSKGLSGREAYAQYSEHSAPVLARVGGQIVWRAAFETTLIGPDGEAWDIMFVARYPNAHAFLAMVSDPEYQRAVVHRQAAVTTSRLIRTASLPETASFG